MTIREIKQLMAGIDGRLATDDVFTMRRTMDELVLAMNLLIGLVEGHRHKYDLLSRVNEYTRPRLTGLMQAMEGR